MSSGHSMRLGVLETHPIQYKVPLWRELAGREEVSLTVYYCMLPDSGQQGAGFGVEFSWDVPLLDGYRHEVLQNVAREPSVVSFRGCDTPGISRVIRAGGFDAFLVNGWVVKSCIQALLACRRSGVPCMVRGEANMLRRRATWKRFGHRLLLRQFARYLCIGEANRQFYAANGVKESVMFRVPYGVDNDRFAEASRRTEPGRAAMREKWDIAVDATVVLFCGKLEPKKRPVDLMQAFAAMHARHPGRSHLLVAGDGPLMDACRQIAARAGLPVTFVGFVNQSELPDVYTASDVLVLPSDSGETWGLVVNEAMACGLPAIVSDQVGCCLDLVSDSQTGYIYPCGDVACLSDLLDTMVTCPEDGRAMGRRARQRVSDYGIDVAAEGIVKALRSLHENK